MSFLPNGKATCIGSMPHKSADEAVKVIKEYFHDIPIWPQLPNLDFHENMYVQYSEGMPGVHIDVDKEKISFNTTNDLMNKIEQTYEAYIAGNTDYFKITVEHARGLYALLEMQKDQKVDLIKGQITGPISFGLMVTDQDKKSIFYNDELRDAIIKSLALKTKWQIKFLKQIAHNIIIFIDEPYLSSFGSAYINLSRQQVIEYINEIVDAIHEENAVSGIHCCGNTDWSILMETKVDILNFDAFGFAKNILLYPEKIKQFFGRGGILAWGIVPTSDEIENSSAQKLLTKLEQYFEELINKGIDRKDLIKRTLITPSCGTGSLSIDKAIKVLAMTKELSKIFREKYTNE